MSYQVPDYSSSPMGSPATPERRSNNSRNIFSMSNNPSTTPAGPPPSSANSFTPAGQPPSSFMGSSRLGATNPIKPLSFSGQSAFNPQQSFNPGSSQFMDSLNSSSGPPRSGLNREYQPSPQRGFRAPEESDYEDEDSGDYTQEDDTFDQSHKRRSIVDHDEESVEDEEPQYEDDDENMDDIQSDFAASRARSERSFGRSSMGDLLLNTHGTSKGSTDGRMMGLEEPFATGRTSPSFGKIAKDIYTQLRTPEVVESDDLVLNTESIITRLYEQGVENSSDEDLQETLADISGDLAILWSEYYKKTQVRNDDAYAATIGPGSGATNFSKANFLAGLALQLHHLPPDSIGQPGSVMSFPLVLLNWLESYHNPFPDQLEEVMLNNPTPADHRLFWDTIFNSLLRGKVGAVCQLLERSDWRHARAGLGDSHDVSKQNNYSHQVVTNVEKVIDEAANVFRQCPCMNRGRPDWNTRNSDWTLFRLKASQALRDLKSFAEGRNEDEARSDLHGFEKSANPGSYSTIAEKAGSKIPWNIYQNLITLYNFAIGEAHTVIESASDWCEAAIGLLVWWDEGKEDRRIALGRSRIAQQAYEEEDSKLYFQKLRKSFARATADNTDFEVNTLNAPEVALSSLFEEDYESVVGFLRGWSGPVSSAVAEVASIGEWLPQVEPQDLIGMGSLDQEDMDLLGIESTRKVDSVKDQTLVAYAKSVSRRKELKSKGNVGQKQASRAGWEVAIAVLGRLDSAARSEEMVSVFLENFRLDSSSTVDKLWLLLQDVGMGRHAEDTAESYANALTTDTHNYGEAMWYYALAHKADKLKDVLDLLISHSLFQSTAFPATADLDDHLRKVITSPKTALVELSRMDVEAAELLRNLLSGYATLRKFYDIRDEELQAAPATKARREVTRKKEAAAALLAVISSAGDNISGGLYGPQSGAIVNFEFLLALLGEAMPFVNQPNSPITTSQIGTLLKVIEDLQTVGPRVYNPCSEFLQAVLAFAQGLKGSTPQDMLRKSTSNLSGSFSMVGSSMLASQMKKSISSSGVLVKGNVRRGWDWRKGITANMKADDILRILRVGLAKDLAGAWLREVDGI